MCGDFGSSDGGGASGLSLASTITAPSFAYTVTDPDHPSRFLMALLGILVGAAAKAFGTSVTANIGVLGGVGGGNQERRERRASGAPSRRTRPSGVV